MTGGQRNETSVLRHPFLDNISHIRKAYRRLRARLQQLLHRCRPELPINEQTVDVASTPPIHDVLHLFCDANFFLQCRVPEELDWSRWQKYDSVRIIVCDPVLREIDALKNKGNNRQSRRARRASALFRSMRPSGTKVIHDSKPTVSLHIEPQHRRSAELAERLDYSERDDQLIGTVYQFAQPTREVRLLTHDTTPLYTAEEVGLAVEVIPDDWLLPPEPDSRDKQILAFKDQIKKLTDDKPIFAVRFEDYMDREVDKYDAVIDMFTPLTPNEIDQLMHRLKQRHPIATSFGRREQAAPDARAGRLLALGQALGQMKFFVPATDKDISDYRENAYPTWLGRCKEFLSTYHQLLQQQHTLRFTFLVENQGQRPAKDCLVTIESRGHLLIMPPRDDYDDQDKEDDEKATPDQLPAPPSPPRGRWRSSAFAMAEPFVSHRPDIDSLLRPIATARDPNELYYKPGIPDGPAEEFSLECQQWRHADGWQAISGELHFPSEFKDTKGAVAIRIQAENLPEPHMKLIPVRISVCHTSAFNRACGLIDALQST